MTKEQTLEYALVRNGDEFEISRDACLEAMSVWAKNECVGLIQFMYASCAETIPNTRPAKWLIDLNTEVTFEELLKLYEESKTK